MSVIVFAGAAQFAAVGYVASGLPWPGIILLTFLLNARHLLYSAALAPWLRDLPFARRAVMAHVLTDEAFALTISHFRRLGRTDQWGYWVAAIAVTFIPWNLATIAGVALGAQIPDPARLGIDIIFPAAMIGLAVGLITGRRELVAAIVGAGVAVAVALVSSPSVGIVTAAWSARSSGSSCPRPSRARRRRSGPPGRPSGTRCRASISSPRTQARRRRHRRRTRTDDDRPRPPVGPDVRGHLPEPRARPADARDRPAAEDRPRLPPARRPGGPHGARRGQRDGRRVGRRRARRSTSASNGSPCSSAWPSSRERATSSSGWSRRSASSSSRGRSGWPRSRPDRQPRRASASISISRRRLDQRADLDQGRRRPDLAEDLAVDREDLGRARSCRSRTSASGRRRRARNRPRRGRAR